MKTADSEGLAKYGRFSDDGREFIITSHSPPRPWINYLSNENYCALCSHTGGGYSFYQSAGYDRILGEYPSLVVLRDRPGRYIYVHDADDPKQCWGMTWQPTMVKPERFEAAHGQGYTRVRSLYYDIEGEVTYFVPRADGVEVWLVKLTNVGDRQRNFNLFFYADWCLGNYVHHLTEHAFAELFTESWFEDGIIHATSRHWNKPTLDGAPPNERWDKIAFLGGDFRVDGYDCSEEAFIGMYRSWHCPIAVERGACSNSLANGRAAAAALQHNLSLAPGEEKELTVVLGVAFDPNGVKRLVAKYREPATAARELERVKAYWDSYLSRVQVKTPDPKFDLSVNIWNKYQAWVTARWARMDSYYIGGGSITGFRDSWQDILGVLPNDAQWSRHRVEYLMRHQYSDGSCLHNWDPRTETGVKTGHSDDPLWLALGMVCYLKETGDYGILEARVPFHDGQEGTVYEHIVRGVDYTLSRFSPRGLPLMEAADWNDGFDFVGRLGRGESVMVAAHLCWMLAEVGELARRHGDERRARRYATERALLADRVNDLCWDGEWYIRATTDDGRVLGTSREKQGKIYLNAQSWPVLADVAPRERGMRCMDAVAEHLDTQYGPCLFLPAYDEPDPEIGIITRFAPGTKENGTIFNHPVVWAMLAECALGRGDRAYEFWRKTSFLTRSEEPDVYKAEPYVYSEYVCGPDSTDFGQGEFSWVTGTAAWMWHACVGLIVGVRPDWDGLRIHPCMPSEWERVEVTRPFRNATYHIIIDKPKGICCGEVELTCDGEKLDGNLIPPHEDSEVHEVRAVVRPASRA
ncbi:MAG: glycosyl transferase family 36 [Armatimonadota bacterium]|nr:MAG: glycosyl transferase family 36 [Armatimonadota bacterium]